MALEVAMMSGEIRSASIPFLRGKNVYLRPFVPEDAEGAYPEWFNDPEVCAWNGHHCYPYSRRDALNYVERARKFEGELALAIVLTEDDRHIGNIVLKRIDPIGRTGELAILLGDRSSWGKGLSREAARLLFDHAFVALNLRRIHCGTFDGNVPMQRLALSLGMKEEGRRRQAVYKGGRYVDILEYGVLKEEYLDKFGPPGIPRRSED